MSDDETNKKNLITYAFHELTKAITDAKNGKPPVSSYTKLREVYDSLSAAEKKRESGEITDTEMQNTMAAEMEKLKGTL